MYNNKDLEKILTKTLKHILRQSRSAVCPFVALSPVQTSEILAIDVVFNRNWHLWPQTGNQCFLLSFIIYFRVSIRCEVIILRIHLKYSIMAYTITSLNLYWGEWEMDWFSEFYADPQNMWLTIIQLAWFHCASICSMEVQENGIQTHRADTS